MKTVDNIPICVDCLFTDEVLEEHEKEVNKGFEFKEENNEKTN